MIKTIIISANFFVHGHFIDGNEHVYTLKCVSKLGYEHTIVYSGEKLPVNDKKKFFAQIKADCAENSEYGYQCVAKQITFFWN